jgi:hypothetical protein
MYFYSVGGFELDVPLSVMWLNTAQTSAEGLEQIDPRYAAIQYISAAHAAYSIYSGSIEGYEARKYGIIAASHYRKFRELKEKHDVITQKAKYKRIRLKFNRLEAQLSLN